MYFNCEPAQCLDREELCPNQFVLRGYREYGMSKFCASTVVIRRENGLWEPTAWTTDRPPRGYQLEGMKYLLSLGYRISGTFETRLLRAYRRMFRGHYELVEIEQRTKTYNGREMNFTYVEIKEIEHGNSK